MYLVTLNRALKNNEDGEFYVVCVSKSSAQFHC